MVENLPPGKAFGVLMFEHTWAIPLRDAIRRAGGVPLAQGFMTPESIDHGRRGVAGNRRGRDGDRGSADREECSHPGYTGHPARSRGDQRPPLLPMWSRTLAMAEFIEEAAVEEAIEALAAANLLEAKYVEQAARLEAQNAEQNKAFFAETE